MIYRCPVCNSETVAIGGRTITCLYGDCKDAECVPLPPGEGSDHSKSWDQLYEGDELSDYAESILAMGEEEEDHSGTI